MRHERTALAVLVSLAAAIGTTACVTTPPEQDPVVQRLSELDGRLLRIERILSNQSLLEQAQKVDALGNEIRDMRGQIEQAQHQLEIARGQQRDLYADLDRRMQALETRTATTASNAVAAAATDDNAAYQQAFNLVKEGKYEQAATAFTQFIGTYPQSTLLDNAQYWLGEVHYVNKDFAQALSDFRAVVDKYPNSRKLPDAWLKIGYCQYELKRWKEARDALKQVAQYGNDTNTAKLAQQRLAKMDAEGR